MVNTIEIFEMLQNLKIQMSEYVPADTAQIYEKIKYNLESTTNSDYVYLLVAFLSLYVLYSIVSVIVRWLLGTVVGMIKFGIYVATVIILYWIYVSINVSIDMEKGTEELRAAREKLVGGVKNAQEFVHRDL